MLDAVTGSRKKMIASSQLYNLFSYDINFEDQPKKPLLGPSLLEGVHQPSQLDLAVLGDSNTASVSALAVNELKAPDLETISVSCL